MALTPARTRGTAALLALLAVLGLVVVRLATRPDPVPVVGSEAPVLLEPYRYLVRPIGVAPGSAGPPTSAATRVPVVRGLTAQGVTVGTAEARPQAVLFLPLRGLAADEPSVEVVVEPLAPAALPRGYRPDGNRYRVRMSTPVRLAQQGAFATLQLRAATPRSGLVVLADVGQGWRPLETTPGPGGVYGSSFPGTGDFQLAAPVPVAAGSNRTLLVSAAALLVLLLAVLGLRRRRLRPAAADPSTSA